MRGPADSGEAAERVARHAERRNATHARACLKLGEQLADAENCPGCGDRWRN
jgi:hypothetical protein